MIKSGIETQEEEEDYKEKEGVGFSNVLKEKIAFTSWLEGTIPSSEGLPRSSVCKRGPEKHRYGDV